LRDCKRRESKKWWEPNNCKTLRMEPQSPRKSNGRYTTLASSISLLSHHQRVPLSSLARKTMLRASGSLLLQWPLYSSSLTKMLVEWSSLSLLKEKSMWVFDVFAYCFFILVPNVSSCWNSLIQCIVVSGISLIWIVDLKGFCGICPFFLWDSIYMASHHEKGLIGITLIICI